jgi:hypothetical protein
MVFLPLCRYLGTAAASFRLSPRLSLYFPVFCVLASIVPDTPTGFRC